jgi:folate-binding protein YgfZ
MDYQFPFAPSTPIAADDLPLTIISLEAWAMVSLSGVDAEKYLQGQVTADVTALTADQHLLTAHCDAKGKMWSNLRLFKHGEGLAYILRRNIVDSQLAEIKKYAVFSKLTFTQEDNITLLGVAGQQATQALSRCFSTLPDEQHPHIEIDGTNLLYLPAPARYLVATRADQAKQLCEMLAEEAHFTDSQQWLALEIAAGTAVIDAVNSTQFIPQATNLQALGGICFTKGCYCGQEMVARAKYRGANKRALYHLAGTGSSVPQPGDELELQLGENWRRTGTVLAAVRLANQQLSIQVVLNNDLASDSLLRIRDDAQSVLSIQPLPYSLDEQ